MTGFVPYVEWLESLNWIKKGDCVYIVSDMLELAKVYKARGIRLDLDQVIVGLQKLVGGDGTLLFPAFNWDFCKGVEFNYYKTPVRTGALSKAALKRQDFDRTAHPLYSFAVWGHHRQELLENQAVDSFGQGTIFEKMYYWNTKVLVIGLPPLRGITYIHHVEQMVGVPYRYNKEFTGNYTNKNGVCSQRTYRMYVRDLDMDPRYIDGFQLLAEQMKNNGQIWTSDYIDTVPCHLLLITDLDVAVREDILENDSRKMYMYRHSSTERR